MNKVFAVSIVYTKQIATGYQHSIRSMILYANSNDEAIGTALRLTDEEHNGWLVMLKTCIEVNEHFLESIKNPTHDDK